MENEAFNKKGMDQLAYKDYITYKNIRKWQKETIISKTLSAEARPDQKFDLPYHDICT